MHRPTRQHQKGFTLIEMLVIAPIVILAIGAFLSVIISMTGDVIASRAQNNLSYNVQDALNRIETDVKLSSGFLAQNSFDVQSPQGYNDTSAKYTNNGTNAGVGPALILNMVATNANPISTSSSYVFLKNKPNNCSNAQQNTPLTYNVVYYVKKEGTDNVLYRRTIMPANYSDTTNTVCSAPYQQPSCTPSYIDSNGSSTTCRTKDIELVRANDTTLKFAIQYFNGESTAYENPAAVTNPTCQTTACITTRNVAMQGATTVAVSLTAQQTSAGRTIDRSAVLRVSRLDGNASAIGSQIADVAPSAPNISSSLTEPTYATFKWNKVANATGYTLQYQINGGAWVTAFTNQNTTSYTVTTSTHKDVVNARVTAVNQVGNSPQNTSSITIPLFVSPSLQGNWSNFSGYAPAGYTITPDGYVIVRGLVTSSDTYSSPMTILTLPPGYRPDKQMTFQSESNGDGATVQVNTDGTVVASTNTNTSWLSLGDIKFLSSNSPHSWTTLSMTNGWSNRNASSDDPALAYTKDAIGRYFVRGTIAGGTSSDNTVIATLPTDATSLYHHIAVRSGGGGNNLVGVNTTRNLVAKGAGVGSAYFLDLSFLPNSYNGSWNNMTFQNSWANRGGFTNGQYTLSSDGVVTLRGLITGGSVGSVITTLPAGYRPSARIISAATCNDGNGVGTNCRIDILPDGRVLAQTNTSSNWTSLDRISFMAEQ